MIGTLVDGLMKGRRGYKQRQERFAAAAGSRATALEASGDEDECSIHLSDGFSMSQD